MRAVIFDLFCTLVPGGTDAERADAARAMGKALRLDPDAFAAIYHETWPRRFRGELGKRNDTKKAMITLAEGQSIDVTTGV